MLVPKASKGCRVWQGKRVTLAMSDHLAHRESKALQASLVVVLVVVVVVAQ